MMSATPIFEQLCREILDTGHARSVDGTQLMRASAPKSPAHAREETSCGPGYDRGSYLPGTLAGWVCPAG
jgi:hypothetical protein